MMHGKYDSKFKMQVVLESINPYTTLESVRRKYGVSKNALGSWRKKFFQNAHKVFEEAPLKSRPQESPEELKKLIGELAIENSILKKISGFLN